MNTLALIQVAAVCAAVSVANSATTVSPKDIQPEKELLITHASVVDSGLARYPGAWSFGTLMAELAGNDGRQFVKDWLLTIYLPTLPGGDPKSAGGPVKSRPNLLKLIVEPWQRRDGYDPKSTEPWLPKLENAPFRLLAIVNRMDLGAPSFVDFKTDERLKWRLFGKEEAFERLVTSSENGVPFKLQPKPTNVNIGGGGWMGGGMTNGSGLDVGEGRLVFGAVDENAQPLAGGWTIIFEYKLRSIPTELGGALNAGNAACVPGQTGAGQDRGALALTWAKRWHALADLDLTDRRFGVALENVTHAFTHRSGNAGPTLAQLRSNDGALGPGREFRQYKVDNGKLVLEFLPGTPPPQFMDKSSREGRALSSFLREQSPLIQAGIGNLPPSLQDQNKTLPLQTAVAYIPEGQPSFHWDLAAPRETRRLFSLTTCNGCHAGETATLSGMHIHPRSVGESARLSDWLGAGKSGLRVDDPAFKNTRVDLREMPDRREIFAAFLNPRESTRLRELREVLRERLNRTH